MKKSKNFTFVLATALVIVGLITAAILAGLCMPERQDLLQGLAETTDYRISSKVPARVLELRVKEGDTVHRGDTLVILEAPDVRAKLSQAEAAWAAANAQEQKAQRGSRSEQVQQAYEMWQKSRAALDLAEKTCRRTVRLFEQGVATEQQRDEAQAQYDAMEAREKAARAQYDQAVHGAREEDKASARAQAARAQGAIHEVASYLDETVLTATADGTVTEVFPEEGELVGTGAPIMNVSRTDDVWFTFNIREDHLKGLTAGSHATVYVPALGRSFAVRIGKVKDVGSFAVWKATKALDGLDLKTFEVKAHPLRPSELQGVRSGMSAVMEK